MEEMGGYWISAEHCFRLEVPFWPGQERDVHCGKSAEQPVCPSRQRVLLEQVYGNAKRPRCEHSGNCEVSSHAEDKRDFFLFQNGSRVKIRFRELHEKPGSFNKRMLRFKIKQERGSGHIRLHGTVREIKDIMALSQRLCEHIPPGTIAMRMI